MFLGLGKEGIYKHDAICNNHLKSIEWQEHAEFSKTIERYNLLKTSLLDKKLILKVLSNLFLKSRSLIQILKDV